MSYEIHYYNDSLALLPSSRICTDYDFSVYGGGIVNVFWGTNRSLDFDNEAPYSKFGSIRDLIAFC